MELQIDLGIKQIISLIRQLPNEDKLLIKKELEFYDDIIKTEEKTLNIPEEHKSIVRERKRKYGSKAENYLEWNEVEAKLK